MSTWRGSSVASRFLLSTTRCAGSTLMNLEQLPWLPADLPFLPAVAETLLDGERLVGGNVAGAVRIGHTVRRPTGSWTPAVHALLDHVPLRGLDGVPAALGIDARGREILTYLPGEVAGAEPVPDALVEEMLRWMRRYHDAVADFVPPTDAVWRNTIGPPRPGEIVCHNDVAPYNVVTAAGHFVGVIDWDMAGPGDPVFAAISISTKATARATTSTSPA